MFQQIEKLNQNLFGSYILYIFKEEINLNHIMNNICCLVLYVNKHLLS